MNIEIPRCIRIGNVFCMKRLKLERVHTFIRYLEIVKLIRGFGSVWIGRIVWLYHLYTSKVRHWCSRLEGWYCTVDKLIAKCTTAAYWFFSVCLWVEIPLLYSFIPLWVSTSDAESVNFAETRRNCVGRAWRVERVTYFSDERVCECVGLI